MITSLPNKNPRLDLVRQELPHPVNGDVAAQSGVTYAASHARKYAFDLSAKSALFSLAVGAPLSHQPPRTVISTLTISS